MVHLGKSTIPGWSRACQIGRSEQQVFLQPCVALTVQDTLLACVFMYPVAGSAEWEAPWVWVPPVGDLVQN